MRIKESLGSKMFDVANYLFLTAFACAVVFPFYYVVVQSLTDFTAVADVNQMSKIIIPKRIRFDMYGIILSVPSVLRGYRNTIMFAGIGTLIQMSVNVTAGYVMMTKRIAFKNILLVFFLIPMFISGGLIPTYLLIRTLGLYNTIFAIILPAAFSVWHMILARTFFSSLPADLEESAFVEGASSFRSYISIYLPLSKAMLAYFVLVFVIGHWNSWFNILIYIQDTRLHTIQIVLRNLLLSSKIEGEDLFVLYNNPNVSGNVFEGVFMEAYKYALMVVVILPVLCVYPFLQKHFVKGIMIGSLKG